MVIREDISQNIFPLETSQSGSVCDKLTGKSELQISGTSGKKRWIV
jgi:hypothetical protein